MDHASGEWPIGSRMNDYVWDGEQWVPSGDGAGNTFDGSRWRRPPTAQFPPLPAGAAGPVFADPQYAYGLTRQTSDDLQFIARYTRIMIIVGLVLASLFLVLNVVFVGSIAALLNLLLQGPAR